MPSGPSRSSTTVAAGIATSVGARGRRRRRPSPVRRYRCARKETCVTTLDESLPVPGVTLRPRGGDSCRGDAQQRGEEGRLMRRAIPTSSSEAPASRASSENPGVLGRQAVALGVGPMGVVARHPGPARARRGGTGRRPDLGVGGATGVVPGRDPALTGPAPCRRHGRAHRAAASRRLPGRARRMARAAGGCRRRDRSAGESPRRGWLRDGGSRRRRRDGRGPRKLVYRVARCFPDRRGCVPAPGRRDWRDTAAWGTGPVLGGLVGAAVLFSVLGRGHVEQMSGIGTVLPFAKLRGCCSRYARRCAPGRSCPRSRPMSCVLDLVAGVLFADDRRADPHVVSRDRGTGGPGGRAPAGRASTRAPPPGPGGHRPARGRRPR